MSEIIFVGVVLWLWGLAGGKKKPYPGEVNPVIFGTGELPDPDEPEPQGPTPLEIWTANVTDTPTVGAGYQIKSGESLFGDDGLIVQALTKALGRQPTIPERIQYYGAIGRVRSNWRLCGTRASPTTPAVERFTVLGPAGPEQGTITAALCPVNDRFKAAVAQGTLPNRLIGWTRKAGTGKCGTVRTLENWKALLHGPSRVWACLWFPPLSAMDAGTDVTASPEYDWPAELYAAAGTTWAAWVP